MASSPVPVRHPYLMLGEGKRDQIFLERLAENRGIQNIQFEAGSGYTGFEKQLKGAWSARTGFDQLKGLIIVGDNDPNEGKTFKSIREQLQRVGLAAPHSPLTIARKQDSPPVAIVMMPFDGTNNLVNGALESLLLPAVQDAHPHETQCYEAMYQCVGAHLWASASSRDKLRVRCIMSSSCPDNPMCGVERWFSTTPSQLIPMDHAIFNGVASLLSRVNDWFESGLDEWMEFLAA